MYAIISELDSLSSEIVSSIWHKLCETCGLKAIYDIPTPHFTWFAAENINLEVVEKELVKILNETQEFTLHTFGIGIFTGENPVLYLPMVKSLEMIELHNKIWDKISPHGETLKLYYSPALWVPHITLALKDLTQENLACAVKSIAFNPIELYVSVDNLAIAEYDDKNIGKILNQLYFKR